MIVILDFIGDVISFMMMLAAVAAILYLSYIVSRKLSTGMGSTGMSKNIRILDRAFVGRDKSVVIIRVGHKDYLLGVSQESVRLLKELEDGQVLYDEGYEDQTEPTHFATIIKTKMGDREESLQKRRFMKK